MKLKRFFGFYFALGCIFLFDPTVKLFDVLPNCIGFLLIATALKELNVLEYRIESAMKLCYYGAAIGAVRLGLMFFTFDMNTNDMLAAVTFLGVAETIVLIAFFISFFGGLCYLGERCESENVLGNIDGIRTLSVIFTVAHALCTVLPELFAIIELAVIDEPDSFPNLSLGRLSVYKNYALVLAAVIGAVVGIWWLKSILSYIKGIKNDESFRNSVEKRYGEYMDFSPREEDYIKIKSALVLLFAGVLFSLNLRFYDEVGYRSILLVPAGAGGLMFALAALRLGASKGAVISVTAIGALQLLLGYGLTDGAFADVGAVLIPLGVCASAFIAETALERKVIECLNVTVSRALWLQRVPMLLYAAASIAYGFAEKNLIHSLKTVFFVVWVLAAAWNLSNVKDEIRSRRKTH